MILVTLEVLAFLTTVGLAVLWIRNPDGSYEPWTVICGVIASGIEFYRRFRPHRKLDHPVPPTPPDITSGSSEAVVEELRAANGVRALRPLEGGKNLEQLPNGVFGFVVPWALDRDNRERNDPLSIGLRRSKGGTFIVEIHKDASGEVFVIGFISQSSQVQLEDPSRTTPIDIHVCFHPYDEFIYPVSIPLNRIISSNHRSIEEASLCDMRIQ
jgi:hypothetical protein